MEKLKAKRGGHRSAVFRLINRTEEKIGANDISARELRYVVDSLTEKAIILQKLDDKIEDLTEPNDTEQEILDTDDFQRNMELSIRKYRDLATHFTDQQSQTMESSKAEDKIRYFVFVSAIFDVVVPVFRQILEKYYRKIGCADFEAFLNHQPIAHIMFHMRFPNRHCCFDQDNCINQPSPPLNYMQWNMLYTKCTSSKCNRLCHCKYKAKPVGLCDIDLTLVGIILIEVCDLPQLAIDKKNIIGLRKLKNLHLSHTKEGCMSKDEFKTLWDDLTNYIEQLDPSKKDDLVWIQNRTLDVRLYNKYHIDMIHIQSELDEINRKLDQTNSQIDTIPQKTKRLFRIQSRVQSIMSTMVPVKLSTTAAKVNERANKSHYRLGENIFCSKYEERILTISGRVIDGLMTDGGKIVLCCYNMKCLTIWERDGLSACFLPLEGKPWGVTALNDSTVAVTFPYYQTVAVYDIDHRIRLTYFKLPFSCWGIANFNNQLAVGGLEEIWIMDRQTGRVFSKMKTDHDNLRLHAFDDKLFSYIGDALTSKKTMVCYNKYGEKLFTTSPLPSDIKRVTSLQDGSLYVLCCGGNVYHVSSNGQNFESVQIHIHPDKWMISKFHDKLYNVVKGTLFMNNHIQRMLVTIDKSSLRIYHTSCRQ